jgi:hypothetical protein
MAQYPSARTVPVKLCFDKQVPDAERYKQATTTIKQETLRRDHRAEKKPLSICSRLFEDLNSWRAFQLAGKSRRAARIGAGEHGA